MTTFTTEDRILAEKDGSLTVNVNAGEVTASPPHIVDCGASVMNNEPVAFVSKEDLKNMKTHLCYLHLKPQKNDIPLYTHPAKTLTDEEILEIASPMFEDARYPSTALDFARAILKKASEK